MPQPLLEFGGSGVPLHIAVANGFAPETYLPMLQPLADRFRLICLPPRPLWDEPPPPESIRTWGDFADDLLAGLRAHDLRDVVAVGHSLGALTSLIAASRDSSRFRALILLDPTLLPRRFTAASQVMRWLGQSHHIPLAKQALNRKARFATLDEAFAYWRGKRLFHDWSHAALRIYSESALHPAPDGGYKLKWSPQWEARLFSSPYPVGESILRRVRGKLPILTIRGATSTTLSPAIAARFRAALPEMAYAEIAGHGHLFPQSAPEAAGRVIAEWLTTLETPKQL
jgi:pimeloyl-ACP methyl ester carboxylesterase